MFYPVKVKDSKGKVKKEITTEQLGDRHWEQFKKVTTVISRPLPNTLGVKKSGAIDLED